MFTFKFFLTKSGTLKLRLTNNRKSTEIALGIRATPEELSDALSANKRTSAPSPKRRFVQTILNKVENIQLRLFEEQRIDEDVIVIADMIRGEVLGVERKASVLLFVDFFNTTGELKAKRTNDSFKYTLSTMRKFDPCVDAKTFEDITYAWLSDFEIWMKKRSLSQNTRKIHFGNIRIAMREAYKRELTNNDPFRRFTFRPEKTRKRAVEIRELQALFNYPVEPFAEIYRDMFKLIFFLVGINTVDLYSLQKITNGRVEYKRAKTGRLYSIKIEPEAMEIIEKYRGINGLLCIADRWSDYRNFQHQLNHAIKRIGKARGKGKRDKDGEGPFAYITSYWARHTWATIAADLDIPDAVISMALGHSGENRVTDIYIKRNMRKVDAANRKVIDWVLYGKGSPTEEGVGGSDEDARLDTPRGH